MTYIHYNHVRARETPVYTPKRQRIYFSDNDSDSNFDDYPPVVKSSTPSRALAVRRPSELERFNVFNTPAHGDKPRSRPETSSVRKYYVALPADTDHGRDCKYDYRHDDIYDDFAYDTGTEYERDTVRVKVREARPMRPRRNSYHSHTYTTKEVVPMEWHGESFHHDRKKHAHGHYHTTSGGYRFLHDDCRRGHEDVAKYKTLKRSRSRSRSRSREWRPLLGFRRV